MYDRANSSFLFNLNDQWVLDAQLVRGPPSDRPTVSIRRRRPRPPRTATLWRVRDQPSPSDRPTVSIRGRRRMSPTARGDAEVALTWR